MNRKLTTIKQTVSIPASPEQVYHAFADAEKHSEFTGSKASGKAKVGGKFTAWDGYIYGKYLELEEGKRIVQSWETTDWAEGYGPSKLELTFAEVPDGTELTLVQSDVPAEMEEELKKGWNEFYWEPLKEYFKKPSSEKSRFRVTS